MKFSLLVLTALLLVAFPPRLYSQTVPGTETPPTGSHRLFAEARIFADFNFRQPLALSHLRASATVGGVLYLGPNRHFFVDAALTGTCLLGRGLGASLRDRDATVRPQVVVTGGLGAQGGPRNRTHEVTQFTQIVSPTFRSDYANVISLASSWILVDRKTVIEAGRRKHEYLTQFVGSMFVAVGALALYYHNDGPPFSGWFGDGKDRYFTGGGYLGLQCRNDQGWTQNRNVAFRLSFDRYTSYLEHAYELATAMKLDYVPYVNNANLYNRGTLRFGAFTDQFWGEAVINDSDHLDFQNTIHRISGMAYHRTASQWSPSIRGGYRFASFIDRR